MARAHTRTGARFAISGNDGKSARPELEAIADGCAARRPLRAWQARADRRAGRGVPQRAGDERRRGAGARAAASTPRFLTPKGKMLGDLRVLRQRRASCCSTPSAWRCRRCSTSSAAACRLRHRAAQAHAAARRCCRWSDRGRERERRGGGGTARDRARQHRAASSAVPPCGSSPPTPGVDVLCDAERCRRPCAPRCWRRAPSGLARRRPRCCASRRAARATAWTSTTTTIPQEAGLNERAVSFTKGCYVGQETVARLFYKGKPNRQLRGLRLSAPVAAGTPLRLGEREVGRVGSVVGLPGARPDRAWRSCAARPSRAPCCRPARRPPRSSSCRSAPLA